MAHLFHPTSPGDEGESLLQRAWRRYEGSHQHATEALSSYTSGPVGNPIDVNSILSLELDFLEKFALANSVRNPKKKFNWNSETSFYLRYTGN